MPGALVQFSVASSVRTQLPMLRQGFGFAQCQGLPFALAGVDREMLRYSEANRRSAPDLASDVLDIAFSTYVIISSLESSNPSEVSRCRTSRQLYCSELRKRLPIGRSV